MPGDHHVGLKQHAFQQNALLSQCTEHRVKHCAGNLFAALDRMFSVHQHFRLDDRHQMLFLAERGVSPKGVCIRNHARSARQCIRNTENGSPLGKASTHVAVLGEAVPKPVKSFGDRFAGRAGQRLGPGINLDARNNAVACQNLGKRRPLGALLAYGFIIHDYAADELL